MKTTKIEINKHCIALDLSKVNFAVATMKDDGSRICTQEYPSDIKFLKNQINQITGLY